MQIRRDGTWVHEGKPIRRPAMVQLFASVLKKEGDNFFLVTPVEKVGIQVEDCPFLIIAMEVEHTKGHQNLRFTTNTEEQVVADEEHPLRVQTNSANGEPHPTVHIRGGLNGLIVRSVFYRLVELAETEPAGGQQGVFSAGMFFPFPNTG